MIARGHVQNGVVVLDDGACLSDGQAVTVFAEPTAENRRHSVLDIPKVSVGAVLHPAAADDDVLAEMLEGRR